MPDLIRWTLYSNTITLRSWACLYHYIIQFLFCDHVWRVAVGVHRLLCGKTRGKKPVLNEHSSLFVPRFLNHAVDPEFVDIKCTGHGASKVVALQSVTVSESGEESSQVPVPGNILCPGPEPYTVRLALEMGTV